MQAGNDITYKEQQKLDIKKWILRPMGIAMGLLILLIAAPMLYFYFSGGVDVMNEIFNAPFILVTLTGGLIPCAIMYFTRTRMKLDLLINQKGLNYKYKLFSVKDKFISWDEVSSIEVKKYPFAATRPGQQNKIFTKGQEVFVMTVDMVGVEIKMKDGNYKFFTSNHSDDLIKAIKNLQLNIQIIK